MKTIERETGFYSSFDGTKIYYEIRGQGETIIFVYGIACLMNHFHHQIDHFAKNYRVVTYDLRGHMRSAIPRDLQHMSTKAMARDLLELCQHLNLDHAHFVGHSFGVPVLIEFSKVGRRFLHSLVFINGFARNPIHGMFGVDYAERLFHLSKTIYQAAPELWLPIWKTAVSNPVSALLAGALGGFNLKHIEWKDIEIYARAVAEMSLDMFIPLFEDMMKFNGEEDVKRINSPTLVIAGAKDFVTPLHFQKALHLGIVGSKYIVVDQGSHCTQLDFPDLVNRAITEHITNVDF